jgi:uncharacterized protein YutE (UPF0331/DUF86 family)
VSSADSFKLLSAEKVIDDRQAERMRKMVGFRNTVVHQYTSVDIRIVVAVIVSELDELLAFAEAVRTYLSAAAQ